MAYDSTRGRVVLFGGDPEQHQCERETWEWDGALWQLMATTGPSLRSNHAMVYDSFRRRVVLFGGYDVCGGGVFDETWEWNGSSWSLRATTGPSPRAEHAMAYDSARRVTVLFGGNIGPPDYENGETWEWNGSTWTLRSTSGPTPREKHAMVYDSARGVTILFGGRDDNGPNGETWHWDGTDWTLQPVSGPGESFLHAMAYDSVRQETLLFGGWYSYGETWTFGEVLCNGSEDLKASCTDRDGDVPPEGDDQVTGKLTHATPGQAYTFCLDGGRCSIEVASARGVAKAKWKNVDDGNHTVTVTECGLSALTACP